MKRICLIFIIALMAGCGDLEVKSYFPANPPEDIELMLIPSGDYAGDYLMLFRSGNYNNSRFGGFLIFINPSQENLLSMNSEGEASYILGIANGEDSSIYNPAEGIEAQLAILFSDNPNITAGNIITVSSNEYTLTHTLGKEYIVTDYWLTMRAYLWDSANAEILELSEPGNAVQIPSPR